MYILQPAHTHCERPHPASAGLKASRSASMGMKASAHSDARGALCSIRSQPSAAESCSPTLRVTNLTLPYARTAWWYWRQVLGALSAMHCSTECARHLSARAQCPAEPWQGSTALRLRKLRRHRGQQGCRRSSSTPSSWRAQMLHTRPEEPSLASVGGGMAAGAAFAHSRAADARVRPIFLNHL